MKKRAFTLIEVLVVVGIFLAMIAILAPFVDMAKSRALRLNCAGHLRQISLGLHGYASKHGGAFPKTLADLYPDYVADPSAFDCPASKVIGTKESPDYLYAAGLTEKSFPKAMVLEDLENNHRAGKNIVRVDGSVEWVTKKR